MFNVYINSELKDFGLTEDGESFIAEVYFLTAEDEDGNRWNHFGRFPGARLIAGEECNYFIDIREESKARVERLLEDVLASGKDINLEYWDATYPVYGSRAYQAWYGAFDDWMEEQMTC
jgi:hypothetical protein